MTESTDPSNRDCPDCEGRGWLIVDIDIKPGSFPPDAPNCQRCRGTGRLAEDPKHPRHFVGPEDEDRAGPEAPKD